jgi:hypothetical protein
MMELKHDSNSGFNLKEKAQLIHKIICPHLKIVGNHPSLVTRSGGEAHHNFSL